MKLAISPDWHIGRELEHDAAQLGALVARCIREEVSAVLVPGDVFDRPNVCTPKYSTGAVQAVVADAIGRLVEADIKVTMIPGNHDKAGPGSEDCLRFLDVMAPDVVVVREPKWLVDRCGVNVLYLPWVYDADAEAVLRDLVAFGMQSGGVFGDGNAFSGLSLLMAHVQVIGARMAGLRCCDGGSWCVTREFLESLPFTRFALGDFHARQDLFDGRGGYVGALRQGNFGEEGNPQGFEIWDTDTGAVEWIELYAAPMHETYRPTCPVELDTMIGAPSVNRRRAVVSGWTPSGEAMARAEAAGVRVDVEAVRAERERRVDSVGSGILDDPHALIRLWASQQRPPLGDDDVARLLRVHDAVTADAKPAAVVAVEAHAEVAV